MFLATVEGFATRGTSIHKDAWRSTAALGLLQHAPWYVYRGTELLRCKTERRPSLPGDLVPWAHFRETL